MKRSKKWMTMEIEKQLKIEWLEDEGGSSEKKIHLVIWCESSQLSALERLAGHLRWFISTGSQPQQQIELNTLRSLVNLSIVSIFLYFCTFFFAYKFGSFGWAKKPRVVNFSPPKHKWWKPKMEKKKLHILKAHAVNVGRTSPFKLKVETESVAAIAY